MGTETDHESGAESTSDSEAQFQRESGFMLLEVITPEEEYEALRLMSAALQAGRKIIVSCEVPHLEGSKLELFGKMFYVKRQSTKEEYLAQVGGEIDELDIYFYELVPLPE